MKKLLVILPLVLCFMISCQDKEAMAELEELKAQKELEEQNKALVRNFFKEINNRNNQIFEELCAADYEWYLPSATPYPMSREEELESIKTIWQGFPDINWTIEEMIAKVDIVTIRFLTTGTHKEEWNGIPASGIKFETGGIGIIHIENGKIVEIREDVDLLGMMQQLGMELQLKDVSN